MITYAEKWKQILDVDREIVEKTWEDFNQCIIDKKIVLFGSGSGADKIFDKYDFNFAYVVDNNKNKWEKQYRQLPIENPEKLKDEDLKNTVILIASVYVNDIVVQLKSYGCIYIFSNTLMNYDARKINGENMKYINEVFDLLEDQKSKDIYNGIVLRRNKKIFDYSELQDKKIQYFDNDIVSVEPNEVFVDGGAFTGDTIKKFIKWCNGNYKRIYAYEADSENYNTLIKSNDDNSKIIYVNKALWNKEDILCFSDGNAGGSKIEKDGQVKVIAEKLKILNDDKVTFIKMDIEGAELEALEGMKDIIIKDQPKLAISIYHKHDDLWKIPLYIHNLNPAYKLYIRHYHFIADETIVYAIK